MLHVLMLPLVLFTHCFYLPSPFAPKPPNRSTDSQPCLGEYLSRSCGRPMCPPSMPPVPAPWTHLLHTTSSTPFYLRRKEGTVERKAVEGEQTASGMQKET